MPNKRGVAMEAAFYRAPMSDRDAALASVAECSGNSKEQCENKSYVSNPSHPQIWPSSQGL